MTQSFKDFRSLGFRDKSIDYDSDNVLVNIKAKHKLEGKLSEKENRDGYIPWIKEVSWPKS